MEHTLTSQDIELLQVAENIAQGSPDPDTKVGCVIHAITIPYYFGGCNRFPNGLPLTIDRLQRPEKYRRMMHAEMVALCGAAEHGANLQGSTLYSTQIPCPTCALVIIERGIKRVVSKPFPPNALPKWTEDYGLVTEMFGECDIDLILHRTKEQIQ